MDIRRGASHTGVCLGETGEGQWVVGSWGEIAWGEMPDMGDGEEGSKSHCHVCTLCNNLASSSHVHQNLKCNLKKVEATMNCDHATALQFGQQSET